MNEIKDILFRNRVFNTYSQVWKTGNIIKKDNAIRVEVSRNENLINPFFVYDFELKEKLYYDNVFLYEKKSFNGAFPDYNKTTFEGGIYYTPLKHKGNYDE